jgi:hypothetical protein
VPWPPMRGPDGHAWADAAAAMETTFPLDVHALDSPAAAVLGVAADGAVLVRPDARVLARWRTSKGPRDDLAAAVRSRWFERDMAAAVAASSVQHRF